MVDPAESASRTDENGPIWLVAASGPACLVAEHVVAVSAEAAVELGMMVAPGMGGALLLCLDPLSGMAWTRAGDASVGMELAGGGRVGSDELARLSHVARGWPQHWGRLDLGLVPDPVDRLVLLPGVADGDRRSRRW